MNIVSLLGRVGQTPEVKTINSVNGEFKVINNLSLAVRRNKDITDWVNCKVTGKVVDTIQNYVHKGDMVLIEGSLQVESWEKDGVKNSKMIVNVSKVYLLPNKNNNSVPTEVVNAVSSDIESKSVEVVTEVDNIPF